MVLLPNGNPTVRLKLRNGSSETIRVSHNLYIARARHGFRTVTLKDSTGARQTWRIPDGG